MGTPTRLEDWNLSVLSELTKTGRTETDTYDFKGNFQDIDGHTKLCSSFANSGGGFVVLGVGQRGGQFSIDGLEPDGEIAAKIGQKIRASPTINFAGPKVIELPGSRALVYVFHVPRSEGRPHLPSDPARAFFWKRTNTGCERMTLDEIRAIFLGYEERREKLLLLYAELLQTKQDLDSIRNVQGGSYSLITLDATVLNRLLVDTFSLIMKEEELLRILQELRFRIRIANSKTRIFFAQAALPMGGAEQRTKDHNEYMRGMAENLLPKIERALQLVQGILIPG